LAIAEIQQLGNALRRHQDISRFDIAVDHQVVMRVVHRSAHRAKQRQPLGDREIAITAKLIDRLPLDIVHHEYGMPSWWCRVEQLYNVGMFQRGQRLPLVFEPAAGVIVEQLGRIAFTATSLLNWSSARDANRPHPCRRAEQPHDL